MLLVLRGGASVWRRAALTVPALRRPQGTAGWRGSPRGWRAGLRQEPRGPRRGPRRRRRRSATRLCDRRSGERGEGRHRHGDRRRCGHRRGRHGAARTEPAAARRAAPAAGASDAVAGTGAAAAMRSCGRAARSRGWLAARAAGRDGGGVRAAEQRRRSRSRPGCGSGRRGARRAAGRTGAAVRSVVIRRSRGRRVRRTGLRRAVGDGAGGAVLGCVGPDAADVPFRLRHRATHPEALGGAWTGVGCGERGPGRASRRNEKYGVSTLRVIARSADICRPSR